MSKIIACPYCGKMISTHFPIHDCRRIIRYFVTPAPTIRGWFLKCVTLIEGIERDTGWKEKFNTKREANAEKDKRNRQLERKGHFVGARLPRSGIAGQE